MCPVLHQTCAVPELPPHVVVPPFDHLSEQRIKPPVSKKKVISSRFLFSFLPVFAASLYIGCGTGQGWLEREVGVPGER